MLEGNEIPCIFFYNSPAYKKNVTHHDEDIIINNLLNTVITEK